MTKGKRAASSAISDLMTRACRKLQLALHHSPTYFAAHRGLAQTAGTPSQISGRP